MHISRILELIPYANILSVIVDASPAPRPIPRDISPHITRFELQGATINTHAFVKRFTGDDLPSTSRWPFSPFELGLPEGWTVYPFQETIAILPIRYAASALEELYYTIFEEAAAGLWGPDFGSPSTSFDLSLGMLRLSFTVIFGEPSIPWHVISAFAFNMLGATQRGYSSGYTGWIRSSDGSIYRVVLGLRPGVAGEAR